MTQSIHRLRLIFLAYCCLIFPFFYMNMPIHFLFIDSILAYIPIELYFLYKKHREKKSALIIALFYLIFLPNNLYLITDFIHLNRIDFYPESVRIMTENSLPWFMFALMMIGIFSLLILGFKTEFDALDQLHKTYQWSKIHAIFYYMLLFIIISIGVFLGRFLRLNSIDFITNPQKIFHDLKHLLTIKALIFILLFSMIQAAVYSILKLSQKLF